MLTQINSTAKNILIQDYTIDQQTYFQFPFPNHKQRQ